MRSINELWYYFDTCRVKKGDVKIDSEELLELIRHLYNNIVYVGNYALADLSKEERAEFDCGISFCEYIVNKHMVLGEARREQAEAYTMMKKVQENGKMDDKIKREVYGMYLDKKMNRENLEREVAEYKNNFLDKKG